jgi:hypothetical protein
MVEDYWVGRKQVTGFIGSLFVIFGTFLPIYTLNLPFIEQVPVSLVDIPVMGKLTAVILIAMGILSIIVLAFEEYALLYISGLVSLCIVLTTFVLVESGLAMLTDSYPVIAGVIFNYIFGYDSGWIFLLAGSALLLVTPAIPD